MTLADAMALTDGITQRSKNAKESFDKWAINQTLECAFQKITDRVSKISGRRNDVVHALWGKDDKGPVRWQRLGIDNKIDVSQLKDLRNEIHRLVADINGATRPDLVMISIPLASE